MTAPTPTALPRRVVAVLLPEHPVEAARLDDLVDRALADALISRDRCDRLHRDGALILLLPHGVDEDRAVPELLTALRGALAAQRGTGADRIRLRAALDEGEIRPGFDGPAVRNALRLVRADRLRERPAGARGTDLVAAVSPLLFDGALADRAARPEETASPGPAPAAGGRRGARLRKIGAGHLAAAVLVNVVAEAVPFLILSELLMPELPEPEPLPPLPDYSEILADLPPMPVLPPAGGSQIIDGTPATETPPAPWTGEPAALPSPGSTDPGLPVETGLPVVPVDFTDPVSPEALWPPGAPPLDDGGSFSTFG